MLEKVGFLEHQIFGITQFQLLEKIKKNFDNIATAYKFKKSSNCY